MPLQRPLREHATLLALAARNRRRAQWVWPVHKMVGRTWLIQGASVIAISAPPQRWHIAQKNPRRVMRSFEELGHVQPVQHHNKPRGHQPTLSSHESLRRQPCTRAGAIATASPYRAEGKSFVDLQAGIFNRRAIGKRATTKRQTPVPLPDRLLAHLRRWARLGIAGSHFVEWNGKPVSSVKTGFASVATDAGEAEQSRPPHHRRKHGGGTAMPEALLDSRKGKNYRLVRCLGCEKLSWSEKSIPSPPKISTSYVNPSTGRCVLFSS
jgi:hypothetical protein